MEKAAAAADILVVVEKAAAAVDILVVAEKAAAVVVRFFFEKIFRKK